MCLLCFSAGAGRTGTFCALSTVLERVKAEGILDVFQTVKSLRLQRPHMVQTLVCRPCLCATTPSAALPSQEGCFQRTHPIFKRLTRGLLFLEVPQRDRKCLGRQDHSRIISCTPRGNVAGYKRVPERPIDFSVLHLMVVGG